mmetsp:Transcript_12985/g.31810  ORF Transcript_12985/g.31810 Transcript_12985/m.31810 type:complete len:319 (+) Transcript_12985:138-1094(+)
MVSLLVRFVDRIKRVLVPGKRRSKSCRLQEHMDELKVALCIQHRVLRMSGQEVDFEDVRDNGPFELESPLIEEHNRRRIQAQLMYMFECLHRESSSDSISEGFRMDFTVERRASSIASAGEGVFVKGKAIRGSVIALYPGLVAIPEHGPEIYLDIVNRGTSKEEESNPYAIVRMDNTLIDANVDLSSIDHNNEDTWPNYYNPDTRRNQRKLATSPNPYAIAHCVNHPSAEIGQANVQQLMYDFTEEFPNHLRPYIPNRLISANFVGFGHDALASTMVYIAVRDIEDEEIFVDYRLNPAMGYPEWYTPVDEGAAARRWS